MKNIYRNIYIYMYKMIVAEPCIFTRSGSFTDHRSYESQHANVYKHCNYSEQVRHLRNLHQHYV